MNKQEAIEKLKQQIITLEKIPLEQRNDEDDEFESWQYCTGNIISKIFQGSRNRTKFESISFCNPDTLFSSEPISDEENILFIEKTTNEFKELLESFINEVDTIYFDDKKEKKPFKRISKKHALEILTKQINALDNLPEYYLQPENIEFTRWYNHTKKGIIAIFYNGTDNIPYLNAFDNINYSSRYDSNDEHAYIEGHYEGLKDAKELLLTFLLEVNDFWVEENDDTRTTINIGTVQGGIVGDVGNISNMSTGNNSSNIYDKNQVDIEK